MTDNYNKSERESDSGSYCDNESESNSESGSDS